MNLLKRYLLTLSLSLSLAINCACVSLGRQFSIFNFSCDSLVLMQPHGAEKRGKNWKKDREDGEREREWGERKDFQMKCELSLCVLTSIDRVWALQWNVHSRTKTQGEGERSSQPPGRVKKVSIKKRETQWGRERAKSGTFARETETQTFAVSSEASDASVHTTHKTQWDKWV